MATLKCLVIGDSGVGKTCLLLRYAENSFSTNHLATIGVDFKVKNMNIEGKEYKLQIWDTAGQERFRTITHTYYKGAMGICCVFDLTDRESFNHIQTWMQQIDSHAQPEVQKILVGNKCDGERQVTEEEGQRVANQYQIKYFEASAKMGINVEEFFNTLAQDIVESKIVETMAQNLRINYKNSAAAGKKKTCC